MDLEVASEFLVMASTLVFIKSKGLLPKHEEDEAELTEEELLRRIIEYKKYKEIINSNPIYKQIDLELRTMQKEIVNNYSEDLVNEYKIKKEEYLSNEIVSKYLSLKEEVNNLLNTLQEIINDNL